MIPTDTPDQEPTDTPVEGPSPTPIEEPSDTPVVVVPTETPVATATSGSERTPTRTLRLRTRTATFGGETPTVGGDTPTIPIDTPTIIGEEPTATATEEIPFVSPTPTLDFGTPTRSASPTPTATATRDVRVGSPVAFRAAGHFNISNPPAVQAMPVAFTLGNFNPGDDLDVDLILADAATNTIRWAQNNGRGTFQSRAPVLVGNGPAGLGAADFDGDGVLDVAVANAGDGSISIVINKGDGRFEPAVTTPVGGDPRGLAAIGNLLVVADASAAHVLVATANADGSVATVGTVEVGAGPVAVSAGDIDRDGTTDVAVANRAGNSVSILLATGPNTFRVAATLITGAGPSAVALGDLDRDGDLDLVVAQTDDDTVSVWGGDGRGGFSLAATLESGVAPSAVGIIDDLTIHGVGEPNPDFVVANSGSNDVTLFGGRGDLEFVVSNRVVAGREPLAMVVGQFDNDAEANADVAVAGAGDGAIGVLRGQGGGSFVAVNEYVANRAPRALTAGDFDSDAQVDIVAVNEASDDVSFLKGNGKAALNPRGTSVNTAIGANPTRVASGDFDADGRRDLAVVLANGELRVAQGAGDGTFAAPTVLDVGIAEIEARDLNLDGRADLIAARSDNSAATVYLGGGGGLSNQETIGLAASAQSLSLADIDGDNILDLFVAEAGPNVVEIFTGVSPFRAAGSIDVGDTPTSIAAADFDQDGWIDVAVLSRDSNRVLLFPGLPGGSYAGGVALGVDAGSVKVVAADMNGDPFPDLILISDGTDNVVVHPSDGQGGFGQPTRIVVGHGPSDVLVTDLNANLLPDVVVANALGQTISLLRNVTFANVPARTPTPTAGFGTPTPPVPPTPPPTVPRPGSGGSTGNSEESGGGGGGLGCAIQPEASASGLLIWLFAAIALRRRT